MVVDTHIRRLFMNFNESLLFILFIKWLGPILSLETPQLFLTWIYRWPLLTSVFRINWIFRISYRLFNLRQRNRVSLPNTLRSYFMELKLGECPIKLKEEKAWLFSMNQSVTKIDLHHVALFCLKLPQDDYTEVKYLRDAIKYINLLGRCI